MPIYNYECVECGGRAEKLMRTGDKAPRCPVHPEGTMSKVPSVPTKPRFFGRPRGMKKVNRDIEF